MKSLIIIPSKRFLESDYYTLYKRPLHAKFQSNRSTSYLKYSKPLIIYPHLMRTKASKEIAREIFVELSGDNRISNSSILHRERSTRLMEPLSPLTAPYFKVKIMYIPYIIYIYKATRRSSRIYKYIYRSLLNVECSARK